MKQTEREPLLTDLIGMFVGVTMIAVSYLRQFNDIQYLPGDNRAEPWFDPAVAIILTVAGLFAFLVGSIRLLQGLRARRK
jgi:flagellar motor component MotA